MENLPLGTTMKITSILLIVGFLVVFIGCSREVKYRGKSQDYAKMSPQDFSKIETRQELLKDYAVCSCIYFGNKKDTVFKKDNSFSVLADITQFPPEVYNEVDKFVEEYASRIPNSRIGDYANQKPVLFKCVSLYKTEKLDSLIRILTE